MLMRLPLLALLLVACSEPVPVPPPLDGDGVFYVADVEAELPRLRYKDGQVSRNTSCANRLGKKLNPAIPPMYVNGAPIGFC